MINTVLKDAVLSQGLAFLARRPTVWSDSLGPSYHTHTHSQMVAN